MALKKKPKKEMNSRMAKTPKGKALPGVKKKRAAKVAPIRGY